MSGLVPSMPKSTIFFCNVAEHVKSAILDIMSFEEGSLPVRYLGVPLIASRLLYKDCKLLIERMERRITDWRNKSLSFAGRLQLITSVLSSFHVYWASVFILPARIIKDLEALMRSFLWCQGPMKKGKAKVAWKNMCLPKSEGGLGIRRIKDVNKALMAKHIWSILSNRESLWVQWVHAYKIKNRNFWDVQLKTGCSWGWRKILLLRNELRPFIWHKIGDGSKTSAWFDIWSKKCPLSNIITPRRIQQAGFTLQTTVADIINDGEWLWPIAWYNLFPVLISLPRLNLHSGCDSLSWKNREGKEVCFNSYEAWEVIRDRQNQVTWKNMVWYAQCIPRHAFLLWLVLGRKLKTQDKMLQWDKSGNTNLRLVCCSLCKSGPDSHSHLFFECNYSLQVWSSVKSLADMHNVTARWDDVIAWILPRSNLRSAKSVIGRLLLAASVYFIWQERNQRLFTSNCRLPAVLSNLITSTVRMKLATLKFKNTNNVQRILEGWNLPVRSLIMEDAED